MKIELVNHTDRAIAAWFPTDIDDVVDSTALTFSSPDASLVVGQQSGHQKWNCDIYTVLQPHERMTLDTDTATAAEFHLPEPPACGTFLGGVPIRIGGVRMVLAEPIQVNGAAYDLHYTALVGPMLRVHVWLHWYPDSPAWCMGEVAIVASNPLVPDLTAVIPPNFTLTIGDAFVGIPGLQPGQPLMAQGDWLANGQARVLPITVTWPEHSQPIDLDSAWAWNQLQVQVRGVQKLHMNGNPFLPAGFDPVAWTNSMIHAVISAQHDWLNSPLDPAYDSAATGAQGAQSFVGGPAMTPDPTAQSVLMLGGRDGSWPMVHLEADGSTLDWRGHQTPPLRMFYGRPNFRISSDGLGKERGVSMGEAHGYAGPEDEHWFDFTLMAALRLRGTPALQMLAEAHAVNFLFRWVTEAPGNWLSANRAIGWLGMLATELVLNLKNRELADAVAQRFRDVSTHLIIPQMLPGDAWWGWSDDPRLGGPPGDWRAVPWQSEVMCVGMDLAGEATNHKPARDMALHMAREILRLAWVKVDGRWTSRTVIARDGRILHDIPLGYYDHFGMKAVDVLLRHDPASEPAGEIWRQRRAEAQSYYQCSWFVPGVTTMH